MGTKKRKKQLKVQQKEIIKIKAKINKTEKTAPIWKIDHVVANA